MSKGYNPLPPVPSQITPAMIVRAHMRNVRREQPTLQDRMQAFRYIVNGSTSLPVITIATRDQIEREQAARVRADQNREQLDVSVAQSFSPGPLDG